MILFYDTETTGKAIFGLAPNHPTQPRLVQIAALLMTVDGNEVGSMNFIVKPNGFSIPPEATACHGISNDMAQRCGVRRSGALHTFSTLAEASEKFVCYNVAFDRLIMRGELSRSGADFELGKFGYDHLFFCAMEAMTGVCKLPGGVRGNYKWPKLKEAHKHCFGIEHDNQHDALGDVRATAKIYFWLQKQNLLPV